MNLKVALQTLQIHLVS